MSPYARVTSHVKSTVTFMKYNKMGSRIRQLPVHFNVQLPHFQYPKRYSPHNEVRNLVTASHHRHLQTMGSVIGSSGGLLAPSKEAPAYA